MKNELLPIGTVVKIKNKYLGIITGYFPFSQAISTFTISKSADYSVTPYPFSCMNFGSTIVVKNYSWFNFCLNMVNEKDITEIIFMGYKDSDFEKMREKLSDEKS